MLSTSSDDDDDDDDKFVSPIHTADADATQLDSCVASAVHV